LLLLLRRGLPFLFFLFWATIVFIIYIFYDFHCLRFDLFVVLN